MRKPRKPKPVIARSNLGRIAEVRHLLHQLRLNIPRYKKAERSLTERLQKKQYVLKDSIQRLEALEAEWVGLHVPPDAPDCLHSGFGI